MSKSQGGEAKRPRSSWSVQDAGSVSQSFIQAETSSVLFTQLERTYSPSDQRPTLPSIPISGERVSGAIWLISRPLIRAKNQMPPALLPDGNLAYNLMCDGKRKAQHGVVQQAMG